MRCCNVPAQALLLGSTYIPNFHKRAIDSVNMRSFVSMRATEREQATVTDKSSRADRRDRDRHRDRDRSPERSSASRKVFVRGLGDNVDEAGFREWCTKFGAVEECFLVRNRETRQSCGYGFVIFRDRSICESVVKMSDVRSLSLDGRSLFAAHAKPQRRSVSPVRSGGPGYQCSSKDLDERRNRSDPDDLLQRRDRRDRRSREREREHARYSPRRVDLDTRDRYSGYSSMSSHATSQGGERYIVYN